MLNKKNIQKQQTIQMGPRQWTKRKGSTPPTPWYDWGGGWIDSPPPLPERFHGPKECVVGGLLASFQVEKCSPFSNLAEHPSGYSNLSAKHQKRGWNEQTPEFLFWAGVVICFCGEVGRNHSAEGGNSAPLSHKKRKQITVSGREIGFKNWLMSTMNKNQ